MWSLVLEHFGQIKENYMVVFQFVLNHWSALLAGISEAMGLLGMGGVAVQILKGLQSLAPKTPPTA